MKLTFKLSKEEAEGFKHWSDQVRPPNISDEDFIKQIFFNGVEHLNQKLMMVAQQIMQDESLKQQLESSGINVNALNKQIDVDHNKEPQ